ncbi:hypothetical protein Pmani_010450 [Petrolisthes manimaculis]|uniref:CLIP domain-containing serine protease n=1 Tax=Petrolisthes manimaculis TaxID=1843537 RepID=A0AAE1Q329_9EUCA|nr:hypothetical protein Pmani_010450 [Petrolisthes manimaculis]
MENRVKIMVLLTIITIFVTTEAGRIIRQVSKCGPGESCTPLRSCSTFRDIFTNPTSEMYRRIRQATCNNMERRNLKVCCNQSYINLPTTFAISTTPTTSPTKPTQDPSVGESLLPTVCKGPEGFSERVYNGVKASVGELPWIAVLGYDSTTDPFWGCGGTLITEQYILTAAHCVHPTHTGGASLTVVRLGELDLETERDCDSDITMNCASLPQDFAPAEVILHPDFETRGQVSDDIALIRLDRKAELNPYVRLLCLPPAGASIEEVLDNDNSAEVAGWGFTHDGRTNVLQKASLPFVNKATCNPHFDDELLPEQVCFGGGIQDSCKGDSGGPLMLRDINNILVGIVSRGKDSRCGVEGLPAIYTHVAAYRTWITQNIRP